jgi:recombination protein RecT
MEETAVKTGSAVQNALAKVKKQGNLASMNSKEVGDVLSAMRPQIEMALPKHLSVDRMLAMATTIITKNQAIAKCSAASLMGAVMQASILGFRPVEALGQCYFVPYGANVQFQIGYKGYVDLARRSGQILDIYAECVYKNDEFSTTLGLDRTIKHVPSDREVMNIREEMTHVYAVVRYKDGGYNFVVLTKAKVERLRLRNSGQKASPSGAWATDYDEMSKAKAIKNLAKYMPMSDEFVKAVEADEAIISENAFSKDRTGLLPEEFENIPYADEVLSTVSTATGEITEPVNAKVAEPDVKREIKKPEVPAGSIF